LKNGEGVPGNKQGDETPVHTGTERVFCLRIDYNGGRAGSSRPYKQAKQSCTICNTGMLRIRLLTSVLLLFVLSTASWKRNALYADAVTLWSDAARMSPNKARPYDNLGLMLKERGRVPEAMQKFERAVELQPDNAFALNNLATLYCSAGRREECAALLQKAVSIKPDYVAARSNLALYYYQKGLLNEALREYTAVVQIDPASREAAFARPMIDFIHGQKTGRH
jgi:tetratricopeptide (TPR) repeat protein